jgi:hypothetical protein
MPYTDELAADKRTFFPDDFRAALASLDDEDAEAR